MKWYTPLINMTSEQPSTSEHYTKAVRDEFVKLTEAYETFPPEDKLRIKAAFKLSVGAHRGQERKTTDKFHISHVTAVALILINECGISDVTLIEAALLHDSVEDSSYFGDPSTMSHEAWMEKSSVLLKEKNVNSKAIEMVLALTKPYADKKDPVARQRARDQYSETLKKSSSETKILKMADRLHNLRTQYQTAPEDKDRKVAETRDVLLPIFELALPDYPDEAGKLLSEIRLELHKLENGFSSSDLPDKKLGDQVIFPE